jgi:NAD/NADP transhydrogenase alpha subunit
MNIFDRRVLLSGAIAGLFFALPAAIAQRRVACKGLEHAHGGAAGTAATGNRMGGYIVTLRGGNGSG